MKARCSTTKKAIYFTAAAAAEALSRLRPVNRSRGQPTPVRYYPCRSCGFYHLTKKEDVNADG